VNEYLKLTTRLCRPIGRNWFWFTLEEE